MENTYEKQATDFLTKTNTIIKVDFVKHDFHFEGEKEKRDIYKVTIKRGNRSFSVDFGNSICHSGEYICMRKLAYIEKLAGKFCLTEKEYKKLSQYDKTYFQKNPNFKIPTNYDVLTCLQKYEVGTLQDFCSDFGYEADSIKANRIYKDVCKEFDNVCKIWSDEEIEELQEIQ